MNKKSALRPWILVVLGIILLVSVYCVYILGAYYRVPDNFPLQPSSADAPAELQTGEEYRILSANLGFGAYSADYSFFMDGGKESRARSAQAVKDNLLGSARSIDAADPDVVLLQEVDVKGTRSRKVDEQAYLSSGICEFGALPSVFAQNYDSPYLFYPIFSPHGANKSGMITYSAFGIDSALRRKLPVEESLMKYLDLDRCYSISRKTMADGKELVIYNVHLSAYTSDGTIALTQLTMLCEDMLAEYALGNYCIAGGDFNKDLLGSSGDIFGVPASESDTWAQPIPAGLIPPALSLVSPLDKDAPVASCRNASEPYNEETSFRVTVDGFLVSENVEVIGSAVVDNGFAFSDHNPVTMDFVLK